MNFALPERVTRSAATSICCLTDFVPIRMAEPTPQGLTLELGAYVFAHIICKRSGKVDKAGKVDKEEFAKVHAEARQKFASYGLPPSAIKARQLVFFPRLRDIAFVDGEFTVAQPEHEHLSLFDNHHDLNPKDLRARHESYARVADECLARMYAGIEDAPDDLIHVTCSGYLAPSPVERTVAAKNWLSTTVTHSYHMGCYGAFPAIRMAHGFLASAQLGATPPKERVDIVHTEILSVHRDQEELTAQNIITMTLFADGFIKYSAVSEDYLRARGLNGLKVIAYNEHLLPNSADDMTWVPGPMRFHMSLSIMVPVLIKAVVKEFVVDLLWRAGLDFERERERLVFAIHPGGPKIVEHIQSELELNDDQVALSKTILLENGNMSSATVPHILKAIVEEPSVPLGSYVVALGFGPGLTATGLVLQKI